MQVQRGFTWKSTVEAEIEHSVRITVDDNELEHVLVRLGRSGEHPEQPLSYEQRLDLLTMEAEQLCLRAAIRSRTMAPTDRKAAIHRMCVIRDDQSKVIHEDDFLDELLAASANEGP